MIIPFEAIIDFLTDEGLGNLRIRNSDPTAYEIALNDPFVNDDKYRFSISCVQTSHGLQTIFNGFKSGALLGEDYHGHFYKFVKLLKNVHTVYDAKQYFNTKYLYKYITKENLEAFLNSNAATSITTENADEVYFPNRFVRFNYREHLDFTRYLFDRKVPKQTIKTIKLFVDLENNYLVFPVYDDNKLIFYTQRYILKENIPNNPWKKAYGKNIFPIWNLENVTGGSIKIFEGIFDALLFDDGVAIFGTQFNDKMCDKIIKLQYNKIIVCMDNDKYGKAAKIRIAEKLAQHHNNVYIYNYKGIKEKDFSEIYENGLMFQEDRVIKFDFKTKLKLKTGDVI